MEKNTPRALPPVIRVFLSSTFADMEHERSYFNEVLVPRLNRICAGRGVSFFSVDLRWGITEDEQVGGQVLPICLGEIDRCRPYFIGILGNRYGSLMESVPLRISDSIPWLDGKEGKSITELEMLYAVLDHDRDDRVPYASFYIRSAELSDAWYGHTEEDPKLRALKKRIVSDPGVTHATYGSVEEFGERVMEDILRWCDKEFPVPERIREVRRAWYDGELLRSYVPMAENHSFLDAYCRESHRSLLLHGSGESGKTTLLSAWIPAEGKKLLINCGSDDAFRYWPWVALTVIRELTSLCGEGVFPDQPLRSAMIKGMMHSLFRKNKGETGSSDSDFYFLSAANQENFRLAFLNWIMSLEAPEPVCIVINDLHLLEDGESRMLAWIPAETRGNVRFICSTNLEETVENADIMGWNCKEMPPFTKEHAADCVRGYLSIYGKSLSASQTEDLLASPVTVCPGYLRTVADFLINHGRFHNLDALLRGIRDLKDPGELYPFLYGYLTAEAGERVTAITDYVLGLLTASPLSLTEGACHELTSRALELTALEWSATRSILEQFRVIKGDYWNVTTRELADTVEARLTPETRAVIRRVLGDYFATRLHAATEEEDTADLHADTRQITAYAKAVLTLYAEAGDPEKLLSALKNPTLLRALCGMETAAIRAAWFYLLTEIDVEVSDTLYGIFREILAEHGKQDDLTLNLGGLFVDLELNSHIQDVWNDLGRKVYGTVHEEYDLMSREFIGIMKNLLERMSKADARSCVGILSEALAAHPELAPLETCQLLCRKAEYESRIGADAEFMGTVNLYFETAIRSGNLFEFLRAMKLRGRVLHSTGRNREALRLLERLSELYRTRGELRNYLATLNSLGYVLTALDRYGEGWEQYERAYRLWRKLGEEDEANTVYVNMCNALHDQGKTSEAKKKLYDLYESLGQGEESRAFRARLAGKLGVYCFALQEYGEAETYLNIAMDLAEQTDQEITFMGAAINLNSVCEKVGAFMRGYAAMERVMEFMWVRGEYGRVLEALDKACENLRFCNHVRQVKTLRAAWRKRFATLEGGAELFDRRMDSEAFDSREADRKREALAMAKSEGDPKAIGYAYSELALAIREEDPRGFRDCLYKAAEIFGEHDLREGQLLAITGLLGDCFREGKADEAYLTKILSYVTDPSVIEIVGLWLELGQDPGQEQAYGKGITGSSFEEKLLRTLPYAVTHAILVEACWTDLVPLAVKEVSAEGLLKLTRALSKNDGAMLEYLIEKAFLKDMSAHIDEMKADYQGPETLRLLEFYGRALDFLSAIESTNVGVLAGNIALIYRRRRDEEMTLRYHKLSMEDYLRRGIPYDALIEKMNVATAYREFNHPDEAIATLREALEEAKTLGIPSMVGSIAGNLAANLRDKQDPNDHEEIMACFVLEETYFRGQGMTRDLVISLLNQAAYHLIRNDVATAMPKLEEGGRLTRENRYKEFMQSLSAMEALAMSLLQAEQGEETGADESEEEARAFFEELLAVNGEYAVARLYLEDGNWNADCHPVEQNPLYHSKLRLVRLAGTDNEVVLGAGFLPVRYSKAQKEQMQAYVDWCNTLTFYDMTLMDRFEVQGVYRIRAAAREELKDRFHFYLQLWTADCLAMAVLAVGMMDLAACQGLKLQVLNMDDGDDDDDDDGGEE